MSIFSGMRASASGLGAQRLRMDIIANNIANAETTRTPEGGAYRRKQVVFSPKITGEVPFFHRLRDGVQGISQLPTTMMEGVTTPAIATDKSPTRLVYQPNHPDANPDGFVEYPNVNVVTEMTDMMSATRSYEANVTVLNAAKSMVMRALDIGRG